jgi:hypothetical protein
LAIPAQFPATHAKQKSARNLIRKAMKTPIMTERIDIAYYLDTVEKGILLSDSESIKKLCEETENASSGIREVEPHLDSQGRQESNVLRAAIDELQVQLALGKMDAADELDEIERRIGHGYDQMKHAISRLERLSEEEIDALRDRIHSSWLHLKSAGTIARIRLELADEKSKEKLQAAKSELFEDFEKIRDLAKENVGGACEKSGEWIKKAKQSVGRKAHNVLDALKS